MKNRFADTGKSYAGYFLRFVCCLALTAAASLAQAQTRNQVSGTVTDTAGDPLVGATVVVVGRRRVPRRVSTEVLPSMPRPTAS